MIDPHVPYRIRGPHCILPKMAYRGQGVCDLLRSASGDPRNFRLWHIGLLAAAHQCGPDLEVKPTCSRTLSNDTILRLHSSINVRSAPRPLVETHYEPLMTSQTRRVAICHLLLRGNRWMPVSVNKKLGADDRCSP